VGRRPRRYRDHRADAQAAGIGWSDLVQPEAIDINQVLGRFDLQFSSGRAVCPPAMNLARRWAAAAAAAAGEVARSNVKGLMLGLPATSTMASTMLE